MEIIQEVGRFEIACHTINFTPRAKQFHWHENYEICQLLKTPATFRVDGVLYDAKEGDIIAINEHVIHQFLISDEGSLIRIFQFPLKILLNFSASIAPLKIHIKHEEILAVDGLEEKITMLFNLMEDEDNAENTLENPFLSGIAASLYLLLERHFSTSESVFSKNKEKQDFYRIAEYINTHYKEELTVTSISKELYFSRGHLAAIFKKYAGVSVTDYINTLRITNANYLLKNGASATEAALESGFQSIRTFNNVYKAVMNTTPTKYAKKNEDK